MDIWQTRICSAWSSPPGKFQPTRSDLFKWQNFPGHVRYSEYSKIVSCKLFDEAHWSAFTRIPRDFLWADPDRQSSHHICCQSFDPSTIFLEQKQKNPYSDKVCDLFPTLLLKTWLTIFFHHPDFSFSPRPKGNIIRPKKIPSLLFQ